MLMNKQKPHRSIILLFLLVFSALVLAQDTEKQDAAPAQGVARPEAPAKISPQAGDSEPVTQPSGAKAADGSSSVVKPIKEFKPTEQIEADSAVSFPIDI